MGVFGFLHVIAWLGGWGQAEQNQLPLLQFTKEDGCLVDFSAGPGSIEILIGWLDQIDKLTSHLMSNPVERACSLAPQERRKTAYEWSLARGHYLQQLSLALGHMQTTKLVHI
jgi:hypothetical protein